MSESKEVPVSGKTSGLIELGEFVEWEATHFYVRQRLSSKITEMVRPHFFVDEMVNGAFKSFRHHHRVVKQGDEEVRLIDDFRYEVPWGILGGLADGLFLRSYMEVLLAWRSKQIKDALESDRWKEFLL